MNAICVADIHYMFDIYTHGASWGLTNMFTFHPSQHAGQAKAMNMKIGNYLSNPEAPQWTERLSLGQVAKNHPALVVGVGL